MEGIITLTTKIVSNLINFPLTISFSISSDINSAILLRKELIFIDTTMNSTDNLTGTSFVEVQF